MIDWSDLLKIGAASGVGAIGGYGIAVFTRAHDRVTDFVISRSGLQVRMNSEMIVYELMGKIEQIDSDTKRNMRKATESLTLMPLDKYGIKTEILLYNLMANQPLFNACYENHITRELIKKREDNYDGTNYYHGVDHYIDEKIEEVLLAVQASQTQYPELPELAESLVYRWTKRALIPNIRRSCTEKLAYYHRLQKRTDIIEKLRIEVSVWIDKNEKYLDCLDELSQRSAIREQSNITKYKKPTTINATGEQS